MDKTQLEDAKKELQGMAKRIQLVSLEAIAMSNYESETKTYDHDGIANDVLTLIDELRNELK